MKFSLQDTKNQGLIQIKRVPNHSKSVEYWFLSCTKVEFNKTAFKVHLNLNNRLAEENGNLRHIVTDKSSHFIYLDDPADLIAAVGVVPDGMKIDEVVRVINDISAEYDIVGLTIAEPMPRVAIKIRNMLNQLPLLSGL